MMTVMLVIDDDDDDGWRWWTMIDDDGEQNILGMIYIRIQFDEASKKQFSVDAFHRVSSSVS